ncbi:MAG: asparagine synthetase B, partial [Candidatus Sericytochromatia bacterium]|nr:asparagine synthetase B [Candidatus Sericytochromatia bacterium]
MCGIAALFSRQAGTLRQTQAMTRAIRHRGPDDEGFVCLGGETALVTGGGDTPAESMTDRFAYTPTQRWQDEVPTGTAAVLGHRRLSIL